MRSSLTTLLVLTTGCASFGAIRSAEVVPGLDPHVQITRSTEVGPEAGWFYSLDCAANCNTAVGAIDAGLTWGSRHPGSVPLAAGFGVNGTFAYADLYAQLSTGRFPMGVGGRLGIPLWGWTLHGLYYRLDLPLSPSTRLLVDPSVFATVGNSPNGANPGSHVGFVQGVGLELRSGSVVFTPGLMLVIGRAGHASYGEPRRDETKRFAVFSFGIKRAARRRGRAATRSANASRTTWLSFPSAWPTQA